MYRSPYNCTIVWGVATPVLSNNILLIRLAYKSSWIGSTEWESKLAIDWLAEDLSHHGSLNRYLKYYVWLWMFIKANLIFIITNSPVIKPFVSCSTFWLISRVAFSGSETFISSGPMWKKFETLSVNVFLIRKTYQELIWKLKIWLYERTYWHIQSNNLDLG